MKSPSAQRIVPPRVRAGARVGPCARAAEPLGAAAGRGASDPIIVMQMPVSHSWLLHYGIFATALTAAHSAPATAAVGSGAIPDGTLFPLLEASGVRPWQGWDAKVSKQLSPGWQAMAVGPELCSGDNLSIEEYAGGASGLMLVAPSAAADGIAIALARGGARPLAPPAV